MHQRQQHHTLTVWHEEKPWSWDTGARTWSHGTEGWNNEETGENTDTIGTPLAQTGGTNEILKYLQSHQNTQTNKHKHKHTHTHTHTTAHSHSRSRSHSRSHSHSHSHSHTPTHTHTHFFRWDNISKREKTRITNRVFGQLSVDSLMLQHARDTTSLWAFEKLWAN